MRVRVISPIQRIPGISFEQFDHHWGTIHGPMIQALPGVKSGKVKYTQFHVSPDQSAILASRGLPVDACDGVAEWEAETLEDIIAVWECEEYLKTAALDEPNFFHRQTVKVMVGYQITEWKQAD